MRRFAPTCALVCLLLLISIPSIALENRTFAPVQDGFTTDAETVSPYVEGRVLIKFTPEAMERAVIREYADKSAGGDAAWTGLASLDATFNALDVTGITQRHGSLKNQTEVKRLGIDRWYRVDVVYGTDIEHNAIFRVTASQCEQVRHSPAGLGHAAVGPVQEYRTE